MSAPFTPRPSIHSFNYNYKRRVGVLLVCAFGLRFPSNCNGLASGLCSAPPYRFILCRSESFSDLGRCGFNQVGHRVKRKGAKRAPQETGTRTSRRTRRQHGTPERKSEDQGPRHISKNLRHACECRRKCSSKGRAGSHHPRTRGAKPKTIPHPP